MYRVAICDDEHDIRKWLEDKLEAKYGTRMIINSYGNATAFLNDIHDNPKTDIVIMDIKLEDANGIDVLKTLEKTCAAKIIFITGYLSYAQDIFQVNPSYLLKKPLDETALYEAMDKVIHMIEDEEKESYTVISQGNIMRIKRKDIFYFESEKRKVILHCRQGEIEHYKKLSEVEKELGKAFMRCHQSFLVNMDEIERFGNSTIELYNGKEIPVSRTRYKSMRDRFLGYIGGSI